MKSLTELRASLSQGVDDKLGSETLAEGNLDSLREGHMRVLKMIAHGRSIALMRRDIG